MYKKDKQGIIIVLIALTVLLTCAVAFKWQGTIIAATIGLTVVIVHILSEIHQRLLQLEQAAPSYFASVSGIGLQKIVIYGAALVALFAYANTWMWLAGGALLVLLLCLIHTISAFQTRLLHLEQIAIRSPKADVSIQSQPFAHDPVIDQIQSTASASSPLQQQQAAWMQARAEPTQTATLQNSTPVSEPKQPAWWQPALDWMMHGNPILRVAVAILMVGVVLLLRFASEHWQLSLGVKLGFIASAGVIITIAGYLLQKKNQ